ncbi:cellulose synthase subunit D [Pantoea sp. PNA 14-12]|uniref:cellulose biosynthesis protein BcsD n=1 Tax=Pantoea TaxID=53335 RepID=UPI00050EDCD6|nr:MULTISPECIES: cellulose biosynthesis protein BcsD [Pantoea]KGD85445.1 cellulose synthase [Pantoea stewartii subsp. indologenes]TDS67541.1 cellulose synthase subunit D [Pantoea sp. PNA 14-12]
MSEALSGPSHPHQPGWFDLVSVLVEGMIANAGQEQATAFLYNMGESLAARYALPAARTVQDLERECNLQLARFNWGFVQLQPQDNAILIKHHAAPAGDSYQPVADWQTAFAAILAGLFSGWLQGQGGSKAVPVTLELNDGNTLHFRYQ